MLPQKSLAYPIKNRILVQVQGGTEFQPADILKYFEELEFGPNTEIGTKGLFEMAYSCIPSYIKRIKAP